MSKPIEEFKTQEELNQCLKWWQEKLFLNGWIIKGYLVHGEEIPGLAGLSNVQWVNQCGTIKIRYAKEWTDGIMKQPHEQILVHELLYFKIMGFVGDKSIEAVFYDEMQHQLLEQMAKALIMAKYDIGFDYFTGGGMSVNKRELNLLKYGISGKRYKELCGFCEQYPEWIDKLKYKIDTVKSTEITDMPIPPVGNSDQTGTLAAERVELRKKCELIEQIAIEASADLYQYIIKNVCYEVPVRYLQMVDEMPCSAASFYDARRYFFYLLDKNKKM